MLNKIYILTTPCQVKELFQILNIGIDHIRPFIDELVEVGIFEKKDGYEWFRHEIVQR
jgi:hypothetical protein